MSHERFRAAIPRPLLAVALAASVASLACVPPRGTVRAGREDPLVIIAAGLTHFHGMDLPVSYLVDKSTRTCWLVISSSVAPLDCCALTRVKEARSHVSWRPCAQRNSGSGTRAASGASRLSPAPPPPPARASEAAPTP
jgi:hypothetical protein